MTANPASRWDAADYAKNAAFVPAMAGAVVDLLAPQSGERILDIGCGDGVLTEKLVAAGASVFGVDASPEMIAAAKARGLDVAVADAQALDLSSAYDAAFSNAALHWMLDKAGVARGVFAALKPGGRFVGEMGGDGNVATIWAAVRAELAKRGHPVRDQDTHWYPTVADFTEVYAAAGFTDIDARLIPRPTPLPAGVAGWVRTFRSGLMDIDDIPADEQARIAEAVERRCEPALRQPDGGWTADYVRLRFTMRKPLMRYLPLSDADRAAMLATIGAPSIDSLFEDVPEGARLTGPIRDLPDHASEMSVERQLSAMARMNHAAGDGPFFLGCGAYRHHIPATVDHIIQRGEFLTSYTPYQPEIAQGTLQALFEFQTQVARLYGCDVANASMYDGSTACWEAIVMARRITRRGRAVLSAGLHPHYVSVARTMARFTGDALDVAMPSLAANAPDELARLLDAVDRDTSCVVVQTPTILGRVLDLSELAARCHDVGALLIAVVTEPVSLGLIRSPGEMGADIVVGEGQALGVGLNFGGPYVGLFATREKFVRQMPGRLCGETVDADGKRGFVLTLSTREQHIRREKATSNICTNSGLCALAFTVHMTLLGERGLRALAEANHVGAVAAAERLARVPGVELCGGPFFNEFTLRLPKPSRPIVRALAEDGILAGVSLGRLYPDGDDREFGLVVAVTETSTSEDVDELADALGEALI